LHRNVGLQLKKRTLKIKLLLLLLILIVISFSRIMIWSKEDPSHDDALMLYMGKNHAMNGKIIKGSHHAEGLVNPKVRAQKKSY
jgi:hypothetical protein